VCRVDAIAVLVDPFGVAGRHLHAVDPAVEDVRDQQVRPAGLERDSVGAAAVLRWAVDIPGRHHLPERGAAAVDPDQTQPVDLIAHDQAAVRQRDAVLRAHERAVDWKDRAGVVLPLRQRRDIARAFVPRTFITRTTGAAGHEGETCGKQRHGHNDPARPIRIHGLSLGLQFKDRGVLVSTRQNSASGVILPPDPAVANL
jgi:hypothetical protein